MERDAETCRRRRRGRAPARQDRDRDAQRDAGDEGEHDGRPCSTIVRPTACRAVMPSVRRYASLAGPARRTARTCRRSPAPCRPAATSRRSDHRPSRPLRAARRGARRTRVPRDHHRAVARPSRDGRGDRRESSGPRTNAVGPRAVPSTPPGPSRTERWRTARRLTMPGKSAVFDEPERHHALAADRRAGTGRRGERGIPDWSRGDRSAGIGSPRCPGVGTGGLPEQRPGPPRLDRRCRDHRVVATGSIAWSRSSAVAGAGRTEVSASMSPIATASTPGIVASSVAMSRAADAPPPGSRHRPAGTRPPGRAIEARRDDRRERAERDPEQQDQQRQVGGGGVPPDRPQPEHRHEVAPPGGEPAERADRQRVEAERDDPGREPAEDRHRRKERVEAAHRVVGRSLDGQAAPPQQPDGRDDRDPDDGQLHELEPARRPSDAGWSSRSSPAERRRAAGHVGRRAAAVAATPRAIAPRRGQRAGSSRSLRRSPPLKQAREARAPATGVRRPSQSCVPSELPVRGAAAASERQRRPAPSRRPRAP